MGVKSKLKRASERRRFKRRLIERVVAQRHRCYYCGGLMELPNGKRQTGKTATWDHVVPKIRGGTEALANLVVCCRDCNVAKDHMTMNEFMQRYFGGAAPYGEPRGLRLIRKRLAMGLFRLGYRLERGALPELRRQ